MNRHFFGPIGALGPLGIRGLQDVILRRSRSSQPKKPPSVKVILPNAWPEEPEETFVGEINCNVCLVRAVATICKPCNHACLCVACARSLPGSECPKCKTTMIQMERIYL